MALGGPAHSCSVMLHLCPLGTPGFNLPNQATFKIVHHCKVHAYRSTRSQRFDRQGSLVPSRFGGATDACTLRLHHCNTAHDVVAV